MPDANNLIADDFIVRSINLDRFAANERNEALRALKRLENELIAKLKDAGKLTNYQSARTEALLRQTQATIAKSYKRISAARRRSLETVAKLEKEFVQGTIERNIAAGVTTVVTDERVLKRLVDGTLIQGSPAAEWWNRQSTQLRQRFGDAVRSGVLAGEGVDQIARRIRGTKAAGFQDGIMAVSRREAQALVRTSVQAVTNQARLDAYADNADVITKIQQRSTLDTRTTYICQSYSGLVWKQIKREDGSVEYRPEGHDKSFTNVYNGTAHVGPPRHWQCRSTVVPVTASWSELAGKKVDQPGKPSATFQKHLERSLKKRGFTKEQMNRIKERTRASMNGQVSRDMDFDEWLRTQNDAVQIDALGPERWRLWKQGRIKDVKALTDNQGRPLTLAELKQKTEPPVIPPKPKPKPLPPKPKPPEQPKPTLPEKPVSPPPEAPISPQGTPEAAKKWIEPAFKDASPEIKAKLRNTKPINNVYVVNDDGAFYLRSTRTITMEPSGWSGNIATFRHEYGHYIDHVIGTDKGALKGTPNAFLDYGSTLADDVIKEEGRILREFRKAAVQAAEGPVAPAELRLAQALASIPQDRKYKIQFLMNFMIDNGGRLEEFQFIIANMKRAKIDKIAYVCQKVVDFDVRVFGDGRQWILDQIKEAKKIKFPDIAPKAKTWLDGYHSADDKVDYLRAAVDDKEFPFDWEDMKKLAPSLNRRAKLIQAVKNKDAHSFWEQLEYDDTPYLGVGPQSRHSVGTFGDMVESLTDGELAFGHGKSYLNKRKKTNLDGVTVWAGSSAELFANWFKFSNGPDAKLWDKVLKFFMPKTIRKFEQLVKDHL